MLMMMMSLHAPSIHFHLGAWAITAICTFLAFWINYFQKRDLIPGPFKRFIHPDTVARLDYVATVTGIVGLAGVVVAAYTGFLDASEVPNVSPLDFNAVLKGIDAALGNVDLAFKVQWTIVAVQFFIFAGIIRFYFVTWKRESSVYDQHFVFQILYSESTIVGFFILMVVAGTGGIYVYGKSILSGIPILEDFLPGGNLMGPFLYLVISFTLLFVLSAIIEEKVVGMTKEKETQALKND